MDGTLVFTGLAFNTFLGVDRSWPFTYPLIYFAGTNLNAVTAAIAGLLIEFGTHKIPLPYKSKKRIERLLPCFPLVVPPQD
jgi:hypothetical protein